MSFGSNYSGEKEEYNPPKQDMRRAYMREMQLNSPGDVTDISDVVIPLLEDFNQGEAEFADLFRDGYMNFSQVDESPPETQVHDGSSHSIENRLIQQDKLLKEGRNEEISHPRIIESAVHGEEILAGTTSPEIEKSVIYGPRPFYLAEEPEVRDSIVWGERAFSGYKKPEVEGSVIVGRDVMKNASARIENSVLLADSLMDSKDAVITSSYLTDRDGRESISGSGILNWSYDPVVIDSRIDADSMFAHSRSPVIIESEISGELGVTFSDEAGVTGAVMVNSDYEGPESYREEFEIYSGVPEDTIDDLRDGLVEGSLENSEVPDMIDDFYRE